MSTETQVDSQSVKFDALADAARIVIDTYRGKGEGMAIKANKDAAMPAAMRYLEMTLSRLKRS
jgi:hypothetical protein